MPLRIIAVMLLLSPIFIRWHVLPYERMRYPTCGDWMWKHGRLVVVSARLSKRRYELLILVHETVEALLCAISGVSEADVTDFDMHYEDLRKYLTRRSRENFSYRAMEKFKAPITPTSEPGDDPAASYGVQHSIATAIEEVLARILFVDWAEYEREVEAL